MNDLPLMKDVIVVRPLRVVISQSHHEALHSLAVWRVYVRLMTSSRYATR